MAQQTLQDLIKKRKKEKKAKPPATAPPKIEQPIAKAPTKPKKTKPPTKAPAPSGWEKRQRELKEKAAKQRKKPK